MNAERMANILRSLPSMATVRFSIHRAENSVELVREAVRGLTINAQYLSECKLWVVRATDGGLSFSWFLSIEAYARFTVLQTPDAKGGE